MNRTKRIRTIIVLAVLLFGAGIDSPGQKKTIILVRHAEKDTSETADQNDPPLNPVGIERARRLLEKIGKYRPGEIYSTDYKRTRDTVAPIAQKRRKNVQIYDARKPQELLDNVMRSRTKRFLIAGHSNTIPGLVNRILGKSLFKDLDDAEYGTIWIIRIRNGQVKETEILPF